VSAVPPDRAEERPQVKGVAAMLAATEVRFHLLGQFEVRHEGRPVVVGGPTAQSVLVALLARHGERLLPTQLTASVWGQPDGVSTDGLYHYVSRLRAVLDPLTMRIESCRPGYRLTVPPAAIDAARFEELLLAARALQHTDPEEAIRRLQEGLRLWRGDHALPGLNLPGMRRLAHQLESRRLDAVEDLAELELVRGRPGQVLERLRAEAARQSDRPRLTALLIRTLYTSGSPREAQEVYRQADLLARAGGGALDPAIRGAATERPGMRLAEPTQAGNDPPYQLPADTSHFVGRVRELDKLLSLAPDGEPASLVVAAVDGMAGIGKTALAVRAAHQMADRFPDGNLFVDLHGFTPETLPTSPLKALDMLLRGLGVGAQQIPPDLGARVALYRSRLARRRMLIVLDNARDEAQVRQLLPGTPGCLVVVTSRRRLTGLDDAVHVSLDTLEADDAATLFRAVASDRLSGEQGIVEQIVRLCGELPLAIRIAAARLRTSRALTAGGLLASLQQQVDQPLSGLDDGERSVAAAFRVSYRHLGPDQAHTFGLLGVHPGQSIDVYAAAALLECSLAVARQFLDSLEQVNLIGQPTHGRYVFHDLLRAYAARSAADDAGIDQAAALSRLLNHYSHAASVAMDSLYEYEAPYRPRVPVPATPIPPVGRDEESAKQWLEAELPNLFAAAAHAAAHGEQAHTVHLSTTLARHLRTRRRYHDAYLLHLQALNAAQDIGDRVGELTVLVALGRTDRAADRHRPAVQRYRQALGIAREISHPAGEIGALVGLGEVATVTSRLEEASDHLLRALHLARQSGHRAGEVDARCGLGKVYRCWARYDEATREYIAALEVATRVGHASGQVEALTGHAQVSRRLGDYPQALRLFQRALQIAVRIGDRAGEIYALLGRGQVYRDTLRHTEAVTGFRRALEIACDMGDRNGRFEASEALANALRAMGDLHSAHALHQEALGIARAIAQPHDQARAHNGVAITALALGHHDQARTHWNTALTILTAIGARRAAEVRGHLEALDATETADGPVDETSSEAADSGSPDDDDAATASG
jgi:tetratricopeptide (TPR) repeat protein/DNA-binding SARP family transcriptional activator